jgi:hypothetical protein
VRRNVLGSPKTLRDEERKREATNSKTAFKEDERQNRQSEIEPPKRRKKKSLTYLSVAFLSLTQCDARFAERSQTGKNRREGNNGRKRRESRKEGKSSKRLRLPGC